jgi:hypothetical protein
LQIIKKGKFSPIYLSIFLHYLLCVPHFNISENGKVRKGEDELRHERGKEKAMGGNGDSDRNTEKITVT